MAGVFTAWYAVAITVVAAVTAPTFERRRDTRDVLKILLRNTR
ncbi:hypothetical protein [Kitasatospora mediocidica]|nr:hypothetical protein [Kitasatospora mediocidica]